MAKEREYRGSGKKLGESIRLACDYCKREGILTEILDKLEKEELVNMFKYEYDEELAKEAARLDGYEEGREDGIEKGREEYVKDLIMRMLRKGKSIESIVSDTDIPMYKVIGIKELMAAEA